ncbi:MAG: GNAT family N-acetyltransferase [Actinomycetia bacterium]|nr:GNAT family N-acetyltransferase [Actinomycetes bacterium]
MTITYPLFSRSEAAALASFLASDEWPFHTGMHVTQEAAHARIAAGEFAGEHDRTHWIVADGERVGMIHLQDLGDGTPLFDLRLRRSHREKGLGTTAVKWLTATVFNEFTHLQRIEATTRQDNWAMRRVLVNCGFAKEASYRQAWPSDDGPPYDSIGYGILRSDFERGVTTPVNWNDGP